MAMTLNFSLKSLILMSVAVSVHDDKKKITFEIILVCDN